MPLRISFKGLILGLVGVMLVGIIISSFLGALLRENILMTTEAFFGFAGFMVFGLTLCVWQYFGSNTATGCQGHGCQETESLANKSSLVVVANDTPQPQAGEEYAFEGGHQTAISGEAVPVHAFEPAGASRLSTDSQTGLSVTIKKIAHMITLVDEIKLKTTDLAREATIHEARAGDTTQKIMGIQHLTDMTFDRKSVEVQTMGLSLRTLSSHSKNHPFADQVTYSITDDQDSYGQTHRLLADHNDVSLREILYGPEDQNTPMCLPVHSGEETQSKAEQTVHASAEAISDQMHDLQDAMQEFLTGVRKHIAAM